VHGQIFCGVSKLLVQESMEAEKGSEVCCLVSVVFRFISCVRSGYNWHRPWLFTEIGFDGLKLPVLEPSYVPMENPIVAAEWTMVKRRSRHLSSSSSPTPTNARFGTSRSNSNHVIFGDDWHRPRTPLLSPKLGSLGHLGQVEKARSGLGISKNQAALGVQKFLGFTWRQRAACAPKTYAAKSIVGGPMANHGGGVGGMLRGGANDGNGGGFRGRA
jgi:hypothetical protein